MGGGFLTLNDGKGGVDVANVVSVSDAVEVEEQGIEFGAEVETAILVPLKGWAFIAEIAGKGSHVVGGVGEFEDSVADDFGGGFGAEAGGLIVVGQDDRELFDDVPIEMLTLNFLAGDIIEGDRVKVCQKE